MTMRSRTIVAAAALAGLTALTAGSAQAQIFGFGRRAPAYGYGYDPCESRAQQQRTVTGVLGSVLGGQAGYGTGGLSGVLGEVLAQSTRDKCYQEQAQRGYGYGYNQGYGGYGSNQPYYDPRYAQGYPGYGQPAGYGGYPGYSGYPVDYGFGRPGECRYAPSTVQMPDGRIEQRSVRVCADRSGRFQVR